MELDDYLPRIRVIVRLLLEAALQGDSETTAAKSETAVQDLRDLVSEVLEAKTTRGTGITARKILDEIAYVFGYQDAGKLLIALGIEEQRSPDHVPPPPPA